MADQIADADLEGRDRSTELRSGRGEFRRRREGTGRGRDDEALDHVKASVLFDCRRRGSRKGLRESFEVCGSRDGVLRELLAVERALRESGQHTAGSELDEGPTANLFETSKGLSPSHR